MENFESKLLANTELQEETIFNENGLDVLVGFFNELMQEDLRIKKMNKTNLYGGRTEEE